MTRPDPTPGRRRERMGGVAVVLVGIAVLVLSVVALVGAVSGADSDVSGPAVTLPGSSTSAGPSRSASSSSSATSSASSTASSSGSTSASSSASGTTAAGRVPLVVLNNTGQGGLAQTAAATFTQGGWTVTSTANFSGDILSTCAYYDPDVTGAQDAAEALMRQFPAIKRVKEKFGGLPDGPVVVVLTSDYTAR